MKKMRIVLVAVIALAALALTAGLMAPGGRHAQAGGPWYVATTGDDANDCLSPATACLTIQAAIDKASSGDTINVAAGTYYEHVTIGKSLTLAGQDRETTIIDGGGGGSVIYITANYVTVSGLTVTNGERGIDLIGNWEIHHVTMRDVVVTANEREGIRAPHSRYDPGAYHVVEDCIISNNGGRALYAHQFSKSVIRNCEVFGNGGDLNAAWGFGSLITNNEVHHNSSNGIRLDSTTYTVVEKNNVYSNGGAGIKVDYVAAYNTIRDNIIRHNGYGIRLEDAHGNVHDNEFYHNDLIENTHQAYDRDGDNVWDDDYPSGGNYWSDYPGVDNYSGVNQDEPGSDGIGDTPYVFDYNQDRYPLMRPWNIVQVTVDIKPGSDPNSINLACHGVIPVAILTTADFDAASVDPDTVLFAGAPPKRWALEDVDEDGDDDLILHFRCQQVSIEPDATEACLEGSTYDGQDIEGCDSVRIVPPHADADGDSLGVGVPRVFGDDVEASLQTDQFGGCAEGSGGNLWPPDFNGDSSVDVLDVLLFKGRVNSALGDPGYEARFDVSFDGQINILDVLLFNPFMGASCA